MDKKALIKDLALARAAFQLRTVESILNEKPLKATNPEGTQ
jgi:hypothetical protein